MKRVYPTDVLSDAELHALLAVCPETRAGIRDAALFAFLRASGLRCAEALALLPRHVDLDTGRVEVLRGKGGKARVVGLEAWADPWLRRWIEVREKIKFRRGLGRGRDAEMRVVGASPASGNSEFCEAGPESEVGYIGTAKPLFCSLSGGPLAPSYVRGRLPELARRAGITKRCHAHGLRRAHLTALLVRTGRLDYCQQQAGHSNISTTSTYIASAGSPELIAAVRGNG